MKNLTSRTVLGVVVVWAVFASGGSAGAHSTADRPTLLAQAAVTDCRPGESSTACCIKKYPLDPVGACGATREEVATVLRTLETVHESVEVDEDEDEGDFANNASLPEWKQKCIRSYVKCQKKGWTGNCHDCLRYCEGQHDWPRDRCHPPRK